MLPDSLPISIMNGSTLIDVNSDRRLSDVLEAFTRLPVPTRCPAKGSPSQPLPNMLIVLIAILLYFKRAACNLFLE
jgi:hypothetical protein